MGTFSISEKDFWIESGEDRWDCLLCLLRADAAAEVAISSEGETCEFCDFSPTFSLALEAVATEGRKLLRENFFESFSLDFFNAAAAAAAAIPPAGRGISLEASESFFLDFFNAAAAAAAAIPPAGRGISLEA
eukprot:CAMPEP_0116075434 /NCGR_PEP_ID=MMETSP0322-20121206/16618_1 /TAXON_ID=163516 /ORGANISM="Leptocylindrus danicus var. apora, Strain B651" /LENGTH=132 /DNA_ID=CAMNT_0003565463 /DNA_START=589 /DNA_END=983 /DNA_ORIENTATION=-